jgi:hypothetical protein
VVDAELLGHLLHLPGKDAVSGTSRPPRPRRRAPRGCSAL